MNTKYIIFGAMLTLASVQNAQAQQTPTLTQYIYNRYAYNPAVAGASASSNLFLNHKRQWNNMPESPVTFMGTYDMPITGKNMGLGIQLYNDKASLLSNTGGALTYAYHLGLNADRSMQLSAGLSAGFNAQQFDFSRAVVSQQNDNALLDYDATSATSFNAGAGLNFRWNRLNAGVAVQNLVTSNFRYRTEVVGRNVRSVLVPHTMASVSYKFGNSDNITVEPIVMLRAVQNLPLQFDAGVVASWKEIVWAAAGYRTSNVGTAGINGSIGLRLAQRVTFAYTVESLFDTQDNYKSPFGLSHEITVGYKFGQLDNDSDKFKKVNERLDGHDQLFVKTNAKIDSLGKAVDGRIASTEEKVAGQDKQIADNTGKVTQLGTRTTQNEADIKDLRSRPTTTTTAPVATPSTTYVGSATNFTKIGNVYFSVNSSVLSAKAKSELKSLAASMNSGGTTPVYLTGSASAEGDANQNLLLSARRASAVKSYLEKLGVTRPIFVSSEGATAVKEKGTDRRVEVFVGQ